MTFRTKQNFTDKVTIYFTADQITWIDSMVEYGPYSTRSDVIRTAVKRFKLNWS